MVVYAVLRLQRGPPSSQRAARGFIHRRHYGIKTTVNHANYSSSILRNARLMWETTAYFYISSLVAHHFHAMLSFCCVFTDCPPGIIVCIGGGSGGGGSSSAIEATGFASKQSLSHWLKWLLVKSGVESTAVGCLKRNKAQPAPFCSHLRYFSQTTHDKRSKIIRFMRGNKGTTVRVSTVCVLWLRVERCNFCVSKVIPLSVAWCNAARNKDDRQPFLTRAVLCALSEWTKLQNTDGLRRWEMRWHGRGEIKRSVGKRTTHVLQRVVNVDFVVPSSCVCAAAPRQWIKPPAILM